MTAMHRFRLRFLALLAVLAVVAVACGGGGGDDDGDSSGGGGGDSESGSGSGVDPARCPVDALDAATAPVEITFWHSMTAANETTLQTLVSQYNDSQDKVRVEPAFQGTYDDAADKLLTALRGGELPEVIQLEETRLQLMIDSEAALPAQACVEAADYDTSDHLPVVLEQFTVDEVLWPMPFNVSNPVLYFNTIAFERAGLDPTDPPATFEEMEAAAQAIVDSGVARYGFAIELSPWYVEQWFAQAGEAVVNSDNGRTGRATEATLESATGTEIYEFLAHLVSSGLATNVGRNPSGADALLALGSGDAAMTIGTSAALGSVLEVLSSGDFPDVGLGVGPLPGPTGGGVLVGGASLYLLDRDTTDEQKAASWDFVRWLNEPEQQAAWHAGTGYIPIRESAVELPAVADKWAANPEFRVAYDQLLNSGAEMGGPVIGPYKEFRDAIVESLERMFLQDVEPAEALTGADRAATEAMESYNSRVQD
jgi:sn-glycerol 3-phosphate transport system substrate-binding protein